jgi:hypothetical protein
MARMQPIPWDYSLIFMNRAASVPGSRHTSMPVATLLRSVVDVRRKDMKLSILLTLPENQLSLSNAM